MTIFNLKCIEYEDKNKWIVVNTFNPTLLRSTQKTSKDLEAFKKACNSELYELIKGERATEQRRAALAFVILHLMDLIKQYRKTVPKIVLKKNETTQKYEITHKQENTLKGIPSFWYSPDVCINDRGKFKKYDYEEMYDAYPIFTKTGLSILFSFHRGGDKKDNRINKNYYYRRTKFTRETLQDVVRSLGKARILPSREGFKFINLKEDDNEISFRPAILFFQYPKLDKFYTKHRRLIERLLTNVEKSKVQAGIILKKEVETKDGKKILQEIEDLRPYRERKDYKETKEYLNDLVKMYEGIKVSLLDPKEADEETLKACIEEIELKNRQKNVSKPFDIEEFSLKVKMMNRVLSQSENYPHRVFHLVGDDWLWGRIYGNKGINEIPREMQKLVLINGKRTFQADLTSALPQLFWILYVHSYQDEKPEDFYTFKSLEEIPYFQIKNDKGEIVFDKEGTREKVKLIFQLALNCENDLAAFRAFGHKYSYKAINLEIFREILALMKHEMPWLENYFFKPNLGKELIKHESNYFMELGRRLMNWNIPYLHQFDSLFVPVSPEGSSQDNERMVCIHFWLSAKKLFPQKNWLFERVSYKIK